MRRNHMATINSNHKDRLFRFIFGNPDHKDWTLSLYNAVNGSSYTDPTKIQITIIEDVLYMHMKNDVSFLLADTISIYEQQSTLNPNLPMRCLIYAGMAYSKYVQDEKNKINLYSTTQQKLPIPKLICFYNGERSASEHSSLDLFDAFPEGAEPDIYVRVTMLNINYGKNAALMEACQVLKEYSWFIDKIRAFKKEMGSLEAAVDAALAEMPEVYLIKPLLIGNKAEVKRMCITEYDEERHIRLEREEAQRESRLEDARSIMNNLNLTAQQAIDALNIADMEREWYLGQLK